MTSSSTSQQGHRGISKKAVVLMEISVFLALIPSLRSNKYIFLSLISSDFFFSSVQRNQVLGIASHYPVGTVVQQLQFLILLQEWHLFGESREFSIVSSLYHSCMYYSVLSQQYFAHAHRLHSCLILD